MIVVLVRTSQMTKVPVSLVPREHTTIKMVSPVALIVSQENTTTQLAVRQLALIVPKEDTTTQLAVVIALIVPQEHTTIKRVVW